MDSREIKNTILAELTAQQKQDAAIKQILDQPEHVRLQIAKEEFDNHESRMEKIIVCGNIEFIDRQGKYYQRKSRAIPKGAIP
jgi:ferredoxin-NADP reductase